MNRSVDSPPRPAADYSITLSYTDLDDLYGELAGFMSPDGMFIPISTPRPVGTRLDFDLVAEAERARIVGSGEVAWIVGKVGSHPAGMAVRFDRLTGDSVEILAEAVRRCRESGEPAFDLQRGEGPTGDGTSGETAGPSSPQSIEVAEPESAAAGAPDIGDLQRRLERAEATATEAHRRRQAVEKELEAVRERLETREASPLVAVDADHGDDADDTVPAADLDAARRRIDELEGELTEARGGITQLEGKLDAARAAADEPRRKLDEVRRRLEAAESELAEGRGRAEELEAERAAAEARVGELEEEAGKAGQLEAARLASEERVEALEAELEKAAERVEAARSESQGRLESVEAELHELRQELEETRGEAEDAASLRDELEAARGVEAARASLERELDSEREGVARMQLLVERVRGEHATIQEELVAAQAALVRSQEEKEGLRSALEEAQIVEVGSGAPGEAGAETLEADGVFAEVHESDEPAPPPSGHAALGRLVVTALLGALAGAGIAALLLSQLG